MTKRVLAIVAALGFFRALDTSGVAAATLYALGALALCGVIDLGGALGRKLRSASAPKGGRP